MTALWIIAGILLLLFVLCHSSVAICFSYQNGLKISVRYLCFSRVLIPAPEKKAKKAPKKSESKRKKAVAKAEEKAKEKRSLPETVQLIRFLTEALLPPLDHARRHLRLTEVEVYVVTGGENAAECAVSYGRICGYLATVLSLLRQAVTVKVRACKVGMNFAAEQTRFVLSGKCKLRVWFFFSTGAYALARLVKQYMGQTASRPAKPIHLKGGISHEASH